VRDSTDLLNKLPKYVLQSEVTLTLDVTILYNNIDKTGLRAIKYWTNRFHEEIGKFYVDFVLEGCKLILENNTFQFNDRHY
jgi:very-short-patch-repair endonuclease